MSATSVRTLGEIADFLGCTTSDPSRPVTGLSLDSAAISAGELFIALPGSKAHGAQFALVAVGRGASAVLTDHVGARTIGTGLSSSGLTEVLVVANPRSVLGTLASWFHHHPSQQMQIAGITGTNGKTTTSYLLEAALAAAGINTGLIGTVETKVGARRSPSVRTTPEATDLQALFSEMRSEGVAAVAMEVSSHALSLGRVAGTHFAVSAFTNLTQDHLDFHRTMEEYFLAKASLFTADYSATAIVSIDDDFGRRLIASTTIPALTVSIEGVADWHLSDVRLSLSGSRAMIHAPDGQRAELEIALPGRYNLENALIAVAAAVNLGVDLDLARAGIAACAGVPGRMERIDLGQEFLAVVDYAHTPDAVANVLSQLRALSTGKVITVLGCGGDRDHSKRPLMGQVAAERSDLAIFTNDNPRSEDPIAILEAMQQGARSVPGAKIVVEPDRAAAIALAVSHASVGDIVLVAGKGHEQGQEVAGVVTAFDDREVLRRMIDQVRS